MLKSTNIKAALLALSCTLAVSVYAAPGTSRKIDVPAGQLTTALKTLASQSGVEFVYSTDQLEGLSTKGVRGEFTAAKAVSKLLEGTNLEVTVHESGALLIAPRSTASVPMAFLEGKVPASDGMHLAQSGPAGARDQAQAVGTETTRNEGRSTAAASAVPADDQDQEIVVTGTNIRGARNRTAPVVSIDRDAIERSGVSSFDELAQLIPQNFAGNITPLAFGSGNPFDGYNGSAFYAAGFDIRGLGEGGTLTLLNGRRVTETGHGGTVNVSLLPVSLFDRVEVLTDGSSAVYGSDAVGGVVNFITRKDFEGFQTRARYGAVTSGHRQEYQVGALGGINWGSGGAFLNVENLDRKALLHADRDFADGEQINPAATLIPEEQALSAFGSIHQNILGGLLVAVDVLYSSREATAQDDSGGDPYIGSAEEHYFAVNSRADYAFSDTWSGSVFVDYSRTDVDGEYVISGRSVYQDLLKENDSLVVETQAAGTLFRLPGGAVAAAFGGQYRQQGFMQIDTDKFTDGSIAGIYSDFDSSREAIAAYGELLVPIVGEQNSRSFVRRLDLSIAARYEDYSDFGETFNPKYGAYWQLVEGVALRGTYGTSFRAPRLYELNVSRGLYANDYPDPLLDPADQDPRLPDGRNVVLYFSGGNPDLKEETATTWTMGLELKPAAVPGMALDVTYFDISYGDRIQNVRADHALLFPEFAVLLNRNPDPVFLQNLLTQNQDIFRNFLPGDFGAFAAEDFQVFYQAGHQNLASLNVSGLDATISQAFETDAGDIDVSLNGSYLFDYIVQSTDLDTPLERVDTIYRPAALKLRGSAAWSRNGFTAFAAVNYTGNYQDNIYGVDPVGVESWMTVDLQMSYDIDDRVDLGLLRDTRLSLSLRNVLDNDPPFVNATNGIRYDSANATPLGRFFAFSITKNW